jgi:hypothetical protein
MADITRHFVTAPTRDPEQSYDFTILVSVALAAASLVIVIAANALSGGVDAIGADSVLPYL